MTDRDDDIDFDADLDNPDSLGAEPGERASLKETWESNPLMKIAAVVLGIVVLAGAYITFFGGEEEDANPSRMVDGSGVKVIVGQEAVDESYEEAIKQSNQQTIEEAKQTGRSAMPIPLSTAGDEGVTLPAAPPPVQEDPLRQWREEVEARRLPTEDSVPLQEGLPEAPAEIAMPRPIQPQPAVKMDPNKAQALAQQMRVIISAQTPISARAMRVTGEPSAYAVYKRQLERGDAGGASGVANAGQITGSAAAPPQEEAERKLIVPAGTIAYGQLLNELNSDVRGPVLVHILSGPFTGGRALGQFAKQDEYLTLNFNRIIKDGVSYSINGIAMDEKTTLTGQQSDVDHHYFQRIILPAAASFIEGYASAVAETGTSTTTTSGGGVVQDQPEPDATEELYSGLEEASSSVAQVLEENSNRPITVKLHKGTTMGILFLQPVTTDNADL